MAKQLREYDQFTGWGRERVLLWLQEPRASTFLPCKPCIIINTAVDYSRGGVAGCIIA